MHVGEKAASRAESELVSASALEKLVALQKQLTSLWGRSEQRGERVCDCSRGWFAFVRVVPTRVHICSVPPNQTSPHFLPSSPSLELLFP